MLEISSKLQKLLVTKLGSTCLLVIAGAAVVWSARSAQHLCDLSSWSWLALFGMAILHRFFVEDLRKLVLAKISPLF